MFDFFGPDMIFRVIGFVIAIVVHEFGHALMALLVGDDTAKRSGRVTLNPLAHLDVIGLLIIFIAPFGWAKPVMYDPRNIRINRRLGTILIVLAGPVMNVITGLIFILILMPIVHSVAPFWTTTLGSFVFNAVNWIVFINLSLAIFNLIPIPPLDGWQILRSLLPSRVQFKLFTFERIGPFILILLLLTPIGQAMFGAIIDGVIGWFGIA
ncbi:MAG: site-2 protease family protein [Firmicutes bacterium]|nr:site-2 protease family protein [Bacillota bacterium]